MEGTTQQTVKRGTPKDVFLHLLAIITLYISVGSFVALLYGFIDIWLPDTLQNAYYALEGVYSSIRFSLSALIIIFPAYIITTRFLNKQYQSDPEKRQIRVRKWLVHFTLFVAALIMLGDLVAVVYTFLNGGLTTRFIAQAVSIFAVVGVAFWYYYQDLRDMRAPSLNTIAYGAIIFGAIAIVGGFFIAGSPTQERMRKFDSQRVADLQSIQWQIVYFWQTKQELPQALSNLTNDISGFSAPLDPETGAAYGYEVRGQFTFALCADFSQASSEGAGSSIAYPASVDGMPQNWGHGAGRVCFERTIDPDLYPPITGFEKPVPVR